MSTKNAILLFDRPSDGVRWGWIVLTSIRLAAPLYTLIGLVAILAI